MFPWGWRLQSISCATRACCPFPRRKGLNGLLLMEGETEARERRRSQPIPEEGRGGRVKAGCRVAFLAS